MTHIDVGWELAADSDRLSFAEKFTVNVTAYYSNGGTKVLLACPCVLMLPRSPLHVRGTDHSHPSQHRTEHARRLHDSQGKPVALRCLLTRPAECAGAPDRVQLAARSRIKELEQGGSSDGRVRSMSCLLSVRLADIPSRLSVCHGLQAKGETLYLSLRYSIASQHTSFIAVSDKAVGDSTEVCLPVCMLCPCSVRFRVTDPIL